MDRASRKVITLSRLSKIASSRKRPPAMMEEINFNIPLLVIARPCICIIWPWQSQLWCFFVEFVGWFSHLVKNMRLLRRQKFIASSQWPDEESSIIPYVRHCERAFLSYASAAISSFPCCYYERVKRLKQLTPAHRCEPNAWQSWFYCFGYSFNKGTLTSSIKERFFAKTAQDDIFRKDGKTPFELSSENFERQ